MSAHQFRVLLALGICGCSIGGVAAKTTESVAGSLRKTGISVIGDMPWGTHFCHFYETKQDLLDTLVMFFKAGLENKEFCLWVVSPPLTVAEAKQALGQAVSDLDRHLAEGSLEIHACNEWYLHNGRCDFQKVLQGWRKKLDQALASGYAGMRASGDTAWIQKDHWRMFCKYENELNALIADPRRILLFTYPLSTSPGNQIFDVARLHQVAVARRHGSWEILEAPELKQAKAEINRLNDELEQKVAERTRELATTNEALRSEIAERKLAVEAVKRAEDRIRLVIDTIPTMAWSLQPDGAVDFVNQRWLDYTGLSMEEGIENPTLIIHPEDLSGVMETWRTDMAVGELFEREMRLRQADGEYRWFLIRTAPLRDERGKIVKWYGTSTDIEDRKRAETQSRALIDAIPQQIWSGPPDGTLDYCNERWRAYMGITLEDLQGDGWRTMLHPDDRDRVLKAWHESAVNGTPYEQEERHRGADGTYRWFLARGVPLRDTEGRIARWYGTNTDIEDRKRAEEALNSQALRYKTLMESSTDSIYVLDEKGDLQEANAAFLRRRGYTAAEVKGLNVANWEAQSSREQLPEKLRQTVGSSAVFETRHRCRDGSVFDVEVCATSVRIGGERLCFCVTRDITERKREEALLSGEKQVLELIATGAALPESLSALARVLEAQSPEMLCSVLLLDDDGTHLRHGAAPSLPAAFTRAIDGVAIGANVGSCGSAAFRREAVFVEDIATDPLWADYRAAALPHGLRACWSTPIFDAQKKALGTFAIYYRQPGLPTAQHIRLIGIATQTAAIAISRQRAEAALRESEARTRFLVKSANIGLWDWSLATNAAFFSPEWKSQLGYADDELSQHYEEWESRLHPEDREPTLRALKDCHEARRADYDVEFRLRHKDGSWRSILARADLIRDAAGRPVRMTGCHIDITERKRAEQALKTSYEQLRALSARLESLREKERIRISREIHDELGQKLTGLKMDLMWTERKLNEMESQPSVNALLDRVVAATELVDSIIATVQEVATQLRPGVLDKLGLGPALQHEARRFHERTGLPFEVRLPETEPILSRKITTALFRIFQECLSNVARHAHASKAEAELRLERDSIVLLLRDNGKGITDAEIARPESLGLLGMKERAALLGGEVHLERGPERGTIVTVRIPQPRPPHQTGKAV